jgi:vacuolar-type H+-ATPase subunit B/Vma2
MPSPPVGQSDVRASIDSPEQYIFELSLYLLTAARGCVGEPHIYGPFRLLEAISRLTDLYSKTDKLKPDEFLLKAKKEIDEKKYVMMASEEEFIALMDKLITEFTSELERRYVAAGKAIL